MLEYWTVSWRRCRKSTGLAFLVLGAVLGRLTKTTLPLRQHLPDVWRLSSLLPRSTYLQVRLGRSLRARSPSASAVAVSLGNAILISLLTVSGVVRAQAPGGSGAELVEPAVLERAITSTGQVPVRLAERTGERLADPFFADGKLRLVSPRAFRGLARVEKPGLPVFDPGSMAWYASANGQLVRLETSGRLVVIADDVQGADVDVRAAQGLAVSREGGDRIVLHRFGTWGQSRSTILAGEGFFQPRFSPDGSRILVAESRPGGGHLWIADLDGGTWDVGQGYGGSWLPDSSGIVFSRTTNDSMRITSGDLWRLDLASAKGTKLTDTAGLAEIEPVVTLDGWHIVFVDAFTGDVLLAPIPSVGKEVAP